MKKVCEDFQFFFHEERIMWFNLLRKPLRFLRRRSFRVTGVSSCQATRYVPSHGTTLNDNDIIVYPPRYNITEWL